MITKKILIGGLLLIVVVGGIKAFAYSRLSNEKKVEHITKKMAKKLSLSEDQKAKVYIINLERVNGHTKAYKQNRKKEIINQAVIKWETELKQVLTAEQAKKLKI